MSIAKEGWILNYSQQYLAIKNRLNESVVLGVLGEFNTGKTFVLSKILMKDIKNINKSHTKSLCFSYTNNNSVLSIDTKGTNLPVNLRSNIEKLEDKSKFVPYNIFKATENVNLDMMRAYKTKGKKYDFLDTYSDRK